MSTPSTKATELPKSGADFSTALILATGFVLLMWGVTYWAAWKLGFQRALDVPLATFTAGDKEHYTPWAFMAWHFRYSAHPTAGQILDAAWYAFLVGFVVLFVGLTVILGIIKRKLGAVKSHVSFSSDWADDIDVEFSGLLARDAWASKKELASLA
ncbi:hypothetical protein [Ramlibacter alkalitolerans]|uniref:Uncharacterized protein n=1 Tax=Ramlibacter alkalitolerans TaxID=2039631 RepID=A0ABS1JU21_9BURK|nr:hypothetical protein [Ramlibacter alkalitolerans]MBL0427790.1 hypothetical protein [Ramlibacter alkalitolerans]